MVILKEQGTSQNFKIIPRVNQADSIVIKGITGSTTYSFTPTYDLYYMVVEGTFALKEGQQYSFEVKNGTEIVYKGRIFCTNQTISDYTINSGQYTQTTSNNDFIII
ncbi:MAG: hypothetical protein Unbinned3907contig1000_12 [Prokaryotic dsDNA virus sp.]|nr:MAG: hypothetical protein Unbinned3907contig1000_12 [Prokaryotic dsDNA virus sp.]